MDNKISALFIDDNTDLLEIVQDLLDMAGVHVVAIAPDKVSAIADVFMFDVIFVDLNLGSASEKVHADIVALASAHKSPIIIVTGEASSSAFKGSLIAKHATHVVYKPFKVEDLISAAYKSVFSKVS